MPLIPGPTAGFNRARPPIGGLIRITPELLSKDADRLTWHPSPQLIDAVAERLAFAPDSPRFALLHGAVPVFRTAGLSEAVALEWTRRLRRELCEQVFGVLCDRFPDELNDLRIALKPIEFPLDGYGVNVDFMGDGIDFRANQQAHFDIVEPLGSNLYGPNVNIDGGWPVFCDGRAYCQDHSLDIVDILDKIPSSRNLTFQAAHYRPLLEDYSVAFRLDMETDTPFTVFVNRVREAGLLHGATGIARRDPAEGAERPISHFAWDNVSSEAADQWYRTLGQVNVRAPGDSALPKPLIPDHLRPARTSLLLDVARG